MSAGADHPDCPGHRSAKAHHAYRLHPTYYILTITRTPLLHLHHHLRSRCPWRRRRGRGLRLIGTGGYRRRYARAGGSGSARCRCWAAWPGGCCPTSTEEWWFQVRYFNVVVISITVTTTTITVTTTIRRSLDWMKSPGILPRRPRT